MPLGWQRLFGLGWLRYPLHVERALAARLPRALAGPAQTLGGPAAAGWRGARRGAPPARRRHPGRSAAAATGPTLIGSGRGMAAQVSRRLLVRDRRLGGLALFPPARSRTIECCSRPPRRRARRLRRLPLSRGGGPARGVSRRSLSPRPPGGRWRKRLLRATLDDLWARGAATSARATAAPGSAAGVPPAARRGFRRAPGAFDFRSDPPRPGAPPRDRDRTRRRGCWPGAISMWSRLRGRRARGLLRRGVYPALEEACGAPASSAGPASIEQWHWRDAPPGASQGGPAWASSRRIPTTRRAAAAGVACLAPGRGRAGDGLNPHRRQRLAGGEPAARRQWPANAPPKRRTLRMPWAWPGWSWRGCPEARWCLVEGAHGHRAAG